MHGTLFLRNIAIKEDSKSITTDIFEKYRFIVWPKEALKLIKARTKKQANSTVLLNGEKAKLYVSVLKLSTVKLIELDLRIL